MGDVPGLTLNRAMQCVSDAWRDINESRLWSFNVAETDLIAPNLTSAGTVTVTQYSQTVIGDASLATPAWEAIPIYVPITIQQFRSGLGEVFNIVTYNGSNTITLDRPWPYASASGLGYQIYRCYYSVSAPQIPPAPGPFLCWESIFDPVNIYTFLDVALSKHDLDAIDPQRGSFDNPVYMAAYKLDSSGNELFEMWPHPQASNPYQCLYRTTGPELVNDTDTLPPQASRRFVSLNAMRMGLDWAMLNQGRIPGGKNIRWGELIRKTEAEYQQELARFSVEDDERCLSYFVRFHAKRGFGLHTGDYLQSHDGYGTLFGL
jgi:hypothetical protein